MLSDSPVLPRSGACGSDQSGGNRGKNRNSRTITGTACSSRVPASRSIGHGRVTRLLCCRPIKAASNAVTGSRL